MLYQLNWFPLVVMVITKLHPYLYSNSWAIYDWARSYRIFRSDHLPEGLRRIEETFSYKSQWPADSKHGKLVVTRTCLPLQGVRAWRAGHARLRHRRHGMTWPTPGPALCPRAFVPRLMYWRDSRMSFSLQFMLASEIVEGSLYGARRAARWLGSTGSDRGPDGRGFGHAARCWQSGVADGIVVCVTDKVESESSESRRTGGPRVPGPNRLAARPNSWIFPTARIRDPQGPQRMRVHVCFVCAGGTAGLQTQPKGSAALSGLKEPLQGLGLLREYLSR